VYDYLLGGGHNFAADRQVAERMLTVFPEAPLAAQANRAFLRRAVQFLVDVGVRSSSTSGPGSPPWDTCTRSRNARRRMRG
jgi:hypothetical protein